MPTEMLNGACLGASHAYGKSGIKTTVTKVIEQVGITSDATQIRDWAPLLGEAAGHPVRERGVERVQTALDKLALPTPAQQFP